ncbi:hypothetical protein HDZ31DRAFT_10427, partial [Schizophyllum fasciatum]
SRRPSSSMMSSRKGPRPCLIWNLSSLRNGFVTVFLMGTLSRTPAADVPPALLDYLAAVYTPMTMTSRPPDWDALPHIHASPCWSAPSTTWLLPLVVSIPAHELLHFRNNGEDPRDIADRKCHFVNSSSMRSLAYMH